MAKKTIALTWWWTWWHILPLLWLYNYLKNDWKYDFIWVWEEWWMEEEIAINNNIKFLEVSAWKIRRYFDKRNFYEPLKNLTWIFQWIYYITKYKIDIIFSKWWYVSIPLCLAWKVLWKKIFIHESDTVWWISNKIVWKLATKIFYTFPNEKIDNTKHILTWQILNQELLTWINIYETEEENEKLNVLVIAWSQGSTNIFRNLINILPDIEDINFNVKEQFLKLNEGFIPTELANYLAEVLLWQMSVESGFNPNATSKSWAIGILQILAQNLKKIDNLDEKNIKVQIYSAFNLYKLIYDILLVYWVHPKRIITSELDLDPINHDFASKYNLSKEEYNKFLVLVMINSYQTWPWRMLKIINDFYKDVSSEQADKREDKTWLGLYGLVIDYAKYEWVKWYWHQSQQYVPLVLAHSKIFK